MGLAFTLVIWLITDGQIVASLSFILSASRVKLGTTGTLKMACNVTENDVSVIYNIQIRRATGPGSNHTWETLAEIEAGLTEVPVLDKDIVNDKGFVPRGLLDKETPINTYLTLDMNIEKLTYSDAGDYRCELTYKSNITGSVASVKRNASLSVVDTRERSEYVSKTTLVIVTVILLVTNIGTIVYARYKARAGRKVDGKSPYRTRKKLIPLVTCVKDDSIQETADESQRTYNVAPQKDIDLNLCN
ncbi:uncharacterized protein LOC128546083 isoform X1 [Mercenaria mercenaria]|uniref:uncharacterized protein LOC128546083 isoform X1 n=1 Tax=Mercenaria mercenaria TaxID=6596 RepID=UPI00234E841A|nr:uncharacterized protein LOC128546083 isoform X1 [Mercenaria mercenaria]